MQTPSDSHRRGISARAVALTCLAVLAVVFVAGIMFVYIASARAASQQETCRLRLRELAVAVIQYEGQHGHYPGYMNVVTTPAGKPLIDSGTGKPLPVSWVVELLPVMQRGSLYERWRAGASMTENLDFAVCPSDPAADRPQRLSYVVNTGLRDLPASIPKRGPERAMPRDWAANGMFFDLYSDHESVQPYEWARAPLVRMRSKWVRDPLDKTILLTENLDATTFAFRPGDYADGNPALTESAWGCNWGLGEVTAHKATPPTFLVPDSIFALNQGFDPERRGADFKYCRPSSVHGDGVNIAFAEANVIFVKDTLNYFIFAKLMASDDLGIRAPGTRTPADQALRLYSISDYSCSGIMGPGRPGAPDEVN